MFFFYSLYTPSPFFQEYSFVHERPSAVAAASLWLAIKLETTMNPWTEKLAHYSGYAEAEIVGIGRRIASLVVNLPSSKTNYVFTKYQSPKYMKIANASVVHSQLIKDLAQLAVH